MDHTNVGALEINNKEILLLSYEILGSQALKSLKKQAGISRFFKKHSGKDIVAHLSNAWSNLLSNQIKNKSNIEKSFLFGAPSISFDPKKVPHELKNSYPASIIFSNSLEASKTSKNERLLNFATDSAFAENQLVSWLDDQITKLSDLKVGIVAWMNVSLDESEELIKGIVNIFPQSNYGKLQFYHFKKNGQIYLNVYDVKERKLNGSISGDLNYVFDFNNLNIGLKKLDLIAQQVVRSSIFEDENKRKETSSPVVEIDNARNSGDNNKTVFLQNNSDTKIDHLIPRKQISTRLEAETIFEWLKNADVTAILSRDGICDVSVEIPANNSMGKSIISLKGLCELHYKKISKSKQIFEAFRPAENSKFCTEFSESGLNTSSTFDYILNLEAYEQIEIVHFDLVLSEGKINTPHFKFGTLSIDQLEVANKGGVILVSCDISGPPDELYSLDTFIIPPQILAKPSLGYIKNNEKKVKFTTEISGCSIGDTIVLVAGVYELNFECNLKYNLNFGTTDFMNEISAIDDINKLPLPNSSVDFDTTPIAENDKQKEMSYWFNIGIEAFKAYFNQIRKFNDFEAAIEHLDDILNEALIQHNIEYDDGWFEVDANILTDFFSGIVASSHDINADENLVSPLHTHIGNALFEAEERGIHTDNLIEKWRGIIQDLG